MFKSFFTMAVGVLVAAGAATAEVRVVGQGATFPEPLYKRWVTEYSKANAGVQVDYTGVGSGAGIQALVKKTADYAGSDAPMSKKEKEAAGAEVVHLPAVAGAVVAAYNLPDVKGDVKLTGEILADIYLGKVTKWSDAWIKEVNADLNLPDLAITPVYRTDSSGTTYVFTSYLTTQSEEFEGRIGGGKQVEWPKGVGGKGNQGVAAAVSQTPGALGYVEHNFAQQNKIPYALLKNKSGNFVKASPETVAAAGEGAVKAMEGGNLAVNIWNQEGKDAYPIAAFTYILVYKNLNTNIQDEAKAKALVDFLWWAMHDGQKMAASMDYAPLAPGVQKQVEKAIQGLEFGGKAVRAE